MNNLLSRLLGESDVVPVLANVPRGTFRKRNLRRDRRQGSEVSQMVGEAVDMEKLEKLDKPDKSLFPEEAEDLDTTEIVVGKPLKQPKKVVQEPSHPLPDREKFQTPLAALTAPDVTPQATEPIDPSRVPGMAGPQKFKASDLANADLVGDQQPQNQISRDEISAKAMDTLLGRNRSRPEANPDEFAKAGQITTEQAEAMLGLSTITEGAQAKAAAAMVAAKDGAGMPAPSVPSNGEAICNAFRRFTK